MDKLDWILGSVVVGSILLMVILFSFMINGVIENNKQLEKCVEDKGEEFQKFILKCIDNLQVEEQADVVSVCRYTAEKVICGVY